MADSEPQSCMGLSHWGRSAVAAAAGAGAASLWDTPLRVRTWRAASPAHTCARGLVGERHPEKAGGGDGGPRGQPDGAVGRDQGPRVAREKQSLRGEDAVTTAERSCGDATLGGQGQRAPRRWPLPLSSARGAPGLAQTCTNGSRASWAGGRSCGGKPQVQGLAGGAVEVGSVSHTSEIRSPRQGSGAGTRKSSSSCCLSSLVLVYCGKTRRA